MARQVRRAVWPASAAAFVYLADLFRMGLSVAGRTELGKSALDRVGEGEGDKKI